jgi:hypothetical protein
VRVAAAHRRELGLAGVQHARDIGFAQTAAEAKLRFSLQGRDGVGAMPQGDLLEFGEGFGKTNAAVDHDFVSVVGDHSIT